jgi:hypothetical protein
MKEVGPQGSIRLLPDTVHFYTGSFDFPFDLRPEATRAGGAPGEVVREPGDTAL